MNKFSFISRRLVFIVLVVNFFTFATCQKSDSVLADKNYIKQLIQNKKYNLAREFFCLTQQTVKKSDSNLCETIINFNNTKELLKLCKNDNKEEQRKCFDVFYRRK